MMYLGKCAPLSRCRSATTSPIQSAIQSTKRFAFISFFCHIYHSDKQVCKDVERQECTEVEKEQCSPKTVTECNDVTTEVCNLVPKEVCDLEKKIVMVEKTEEKCSGPADVPKTTTTTTTTVAPERETAVKPSNSYLPPPAATAGKENPVPIDIFVYFW